MDSLLWTATTLAWLVAYQARQQDGWAARGIRPVLGWGPVAVAQIAAGAGAAVLIVPTWGPGAGVAAAAFAWLCTLAVATDLATRKIPWDVSYPVALVGLISFATSYTREGMLALGAAMLGVVGLPYAARALTRNGLGMSDVRLLFAATATTSWWIGQTWLLWALIAASLGQLVVRLVAPRFGWGEQVPVPASARSQAHTEHGLGIEAGTAPQPARPVRTRLELPFAPALVLSVWAFIGYGTHTVTGACQVWNPFGCT